jgi:hypothetical protein
MRPELIAPPRVKASAVDSPAWPFLSVHHRAFLAAFYGLLLSGVAVVSAVLTVQSLRWPLIHDAPLMHYAAWLIRTGGVPYRDIFDMNAPGTYLVHLGALVLFGHSDLGMRLFDLATLAIMGGLIVHLCRRFGPWSGATAALLFWLFHLSGGAWRAGQRDYLASLPLLASLVPIWRERIGPLNIAVAFGWLGAASLIKPHVAAFAVLLAAALCARRENRFPRAQKAKVVGWAMIGFSLPVAACAAWLHVAGGLLPFLEILRGYLIPLYSRLGRASLVEAVRWQVLGWETLTLLAALSLLTSFSLFAMKRWSWCHTVLGLGVCYGLFHFWVQGKGWEYHLYPLVLFGILLGSSVIDQLVIRRQLPPKLIAVSLVGLLTLTLAVKGFWGLDAEWIVKKERRVSEIVSFLEPRLAPGATVQTLDTTEGGIHALFRMGLRQPTRFLYDFHFYHDIGQPVIERLRAELVTRLAEAPPTFVLAFRDNWLRHDFSRFDEFPALKDLLNRRYRVLREAGGYRIYEKLNDS